MPPFTRNASSTFRRNFTTLWVTALLAIIAMLVVTLGVWDLHVRLGIGMLCSALAILFIVFQRQAAPRAASTAPDSPDGESELFAAVSVLVTDRLKEIDAFVQKEDHGLEGLGETEERLRQARDFSLAAAIAQAPEIVLDEKKILQLALNRAWRICRMKAGAAFSWSGESGGVARLAAIAGVEAVPAGLTEIVLADADAATFRSGGLLEWRPPYAFAGVLPDAACRVGMPVRIGEYSWGWFLLEADVARGLTPVEGRFLNALGRETAAAITAMDVWRAARNRLCGGLHELGIRLDERRNEKTGRGSRIAALFHTAARCAGLSAVEREAGELAAHLMDLGEIGVPELILAKKGELTPQEARFVRDHPALSVKLLRQFLMERPIEEIVIAHQERWDGSGYPTGLKRDEIPRAARLLAVCDTYEAMISQRPHRDAYGTVEAMNELKKLAGSLFDPAMVAAVEGVHEKWLAWSRSA